MKNLLSKSLLCGVLASTFLIVNCQKAPNRAVTAKVTPSNKPADPTSAACSEDALKEAKSTKEMSEALKVALDKVKDKNADTLTETEKTDLTTLVNNLFTQSNKLVTEIEKIKVKVGDKEQSAQACVNADANKSLDIAVIRGAIATHGKNVKEKTGRDNLAVPKADPVKVSDKLELNDEVVITEALAKLLADETQVNGKSLIVAGKILTVEADIKAAQAKKDVTSCVLVTTDKDAKSALVADAKVLVSNIEAKDNADKSKSVEVALGVKANKEAAMSLLAISCKLAEGKDANVELRSALGSLLKSVVKAIKKASSASGDATKASGDASKASGDATKASGDATKASGDSSVASGDGTTSKQALDIITSALSK